MTALLLMLRSAWQVVIKRALIGKLRGLRVLPIMVAVGVVLPAAGMAQPTEPIPINLLQGEGDATPLRGRYIDAVGVVTGVGTQGFYLQEPIGDGRAATSDGLYVYTRQRPAVQVGMCVLVSGALIDEFYDKTELSRVKAVTPSTLCSTTTIVPAPLMPLRYGDRPAQQYEPLEGMRVELPVFEGVVHGPTKRYASGDAEIALAPGAIQPYLSDGRIFFDEPHEQDQLLYVSGALGVSLPDLDHGDHVRIVAANGAAAPAILDYNFGKYQLLLLPGSRVERTQAADAAPRRAAPAHGEDFTICSYNLMGLGAGAAQYADPTDYARELRRRAATIAEWLAGCTLIGLQESGQPQDAENLAALLRRDFGLDYAVTALPGPQSSNPEFPLTNALLTRNDRVRVTAAENPQACATIDYGVIDPGACQPGQFPLFDRPPLVADVTVATGTGEAALTLIINHWKSKAGDESVNLPRRIDQAEAVAALVQARLATSPDAALAVLGDLNDYFGSAPLETVRTLPDPELVHLQAWLPPVDRYSYVFNGARQVLDHMLVTPALAAQVGEVSMVRINADYGARQAPTASDSLHASDHDPIVVRVWPRGVGWLAGNVRYPGVRAAAQDAQGREVAWAVSDARGDFRLWNLAPGDYRLALAPPSHLALAITDVAITVNSGENRFVTTARHLASDTGAHLAAWMVAPSTAPVPSVSSESEPASRVEQNQ